MSDPAQPAPSRMSWAERTLLLAAIAFVGWFYVWTAYTSGDPWRFGTEQRDYYNWLIDGWLDGHLHMKVDVPAAMLELKDPYDPRQRPPDVGLHDASFYKGKYYVYFGVAPVVLVMLPFRVLTGIDLPLAAAVLVFTYSGFLASLALWIAIRRRYFPDANAWLSPLVALVLGLGGLGAVLLRRPHMWELPIAGGYCFAMLTLGCVWRSLHAARPARADNSAARSARSRDRWFAGAGLCLGLAIASRPTYLLASPLLAVPLIFWWCEERRFPWRTALWPTVPLAAVGALMALHNYLRFGNPLEFGQAYQLSFDYESKVQHFSPRYLSFNTWRYFVSAAQWSAYFPFIAPVELPPKPPGFSGHDDVYGVLTNLPFAWLAFAAPLALWRRHGAERRAFRTWLLSATVLFAVMAGVLLCFFGSLARYELDFTPTLMLLAGVGVLALERWLRAVAPRILRWSVRPFWIGAAVFTTAFGALFSMQLDGRLAERNPRASDAAARWLNHVPVFFETVRGVEHGPIEFTVQFRAPSVRDYDLLSVGESPHADRVFVRNIDHGQLQIGFAQTSGPEIVSRALAIDRTRPHAMRVSLGSLFPPRTHPMFRPVGDRDVAALLRQVRIEMDGEAVIDERRKFSIRAGKLHASAEVRDLHRVATGAAVAAVQISESMSLRLRFPERPPSPREPLIGFGDATGGGVIFVQYFGDDGRISFGWSSGGKATAPADPVRIDPTRVHEVIARWLPDRDPTLSRVQMWCDDVLVWSRQIPRPAARTNVFGRNTSNEPGCAPAFTGRLYSQIGTNGPGPLATGGDTLRMRVQLPPDRTGAREPLLVTGYAGQADIVTVEYVDAAHARVALDHWGTGLLQSEPFAIDYARVHEIELRLSSLVPPAEEQVARRERRGRVDVRIDGTDVWSRDVVLYSIEPDEFVVGRNSVGGTNCGAAFSGDILSVERLPHE